MKMFIVPIVFLTLLPEASFSVDPDGATCAQPLEVNTTTDFYFRMLPISPGVTRITFDAKANNDVHIGLFPDQGSRSDYYIIVLGSYRNSHSDIRRCSSCFDAVEYWEDGIVTLDEFRRFWITFDCNGNIAVGRNEETTPFLQWTDPNPVTVNYMGYSTGWGSTGEFRFCDFGGKHASVQENFVLFLSCEPHLVISTTSALYGYDRTDCTAGSTGRERGGCSAENSKQVVSSSCNNRQYCTVVASDEVFNNNCRGTPKFLRVNYMCIPNSYITTQSPSPSATPTIVSAKAGPTVVSTTAVRNRQLENKTDGEQNSNLQQLKQAEQAPAWPVVIICVIGFLLLLIGAAVLVWKMIPTITSRRGIMQPHRLT